MTEYRPVLENEPYIKGYCRELADWVAGNCKWIKPKDTDTLKPYIYGFDDDGSICTHRVLAETITMTTGAKDRNGRTIFSGDILSIDGMAELLYVFSTYGDESTLIPTCYVRQGIDFNDAPKHTFKLNVISEHIEIIGSVMIPLIEHAIKREDENKDTVVYDGDDNYSYNTEKYDDDDVVWEEADDEDFSVVDIDAIEEDEVVVSEVIIEPDEFISDLVKKDGDISRGLSTDAVTWLYGHPFFHKEEGNSYTSYIVSKNDDGSTSLSKFILETLGKDSGMTDINGVHVFSGDIISIKNNEVYLIKYNPETDRWMMLPYNFTGTKLELDNELWSTIFPDRVQEYDLHPEILGNIYTGIPEPIMKELSTGKYYNVFQLSDKEIMKVQELNEPLFRICRQIDALIQTAVPNTDAEYYIYTDSLSVSNIVQVRAFRPDKIEVRGFYHIGPTSGTVFMGRFEPHRDFDSRHGLIATTVTFEDFVRYYTMALQPDLLDENVIKASVMPYSNISLYKFPKLMDKLDYPNIIKKKFKKDSVSQKEWLDSAPRIFGKKNALSIKNRVLDTVGLTLFGKSFRIDNHYMIKAKYDIPNVQLNEGVSKVAYIMETGADCSYLLDCCNKFIYSCDIIDYEKLGRIVLYMTTENDPNAVAEYYDNHFMENHIYWTFLSEMLDFYETGDKSKIIWRTVNIAEWITNQEQIRIVGNLIDCHIEEKGSIDYISSNFLQEKDPLAIVFKNEDMIAISEEANDRFYNYRRCHELLYDKMVCEEVYEMLYKKKYDPDSTSTDEILFDTVCVSDGSPLIHASVYDNDHDEEYRMFFDPDKSFITIMKVSLFKHMTAGICEYMEPFKDGIEKLREVLTAGSKRYDDIYSAVTNMPPAPDDMDMFQKLKEDVADGRESYTQEKYMKYVEKQLKENVDNIRWRAVSDKGMWFTGNMSDDMTMLTTMAGTQKIRYIQESAGFNTFLLDSTFHFIYENDIIRFDGVDPIYIVVKSESHIRNFGEVNFEGTVSPENDRLMRCSYITYGEACGISHMPNVQWVPCDIDWFIRNRDRLTVIGNVFDLAAEVYSDVQ